MPVFNYKSVFGWRERQREGEGWRETPIPLFGWREERKERRDGGMSSPSGPTILHHSIFPLPFSIEKIFLSSKKFWKDFRNK